HPNDSLFAVTNAMNIEGPPRLFLSTDLGKEWREISEGLFGQVSSIFLDPDHPDQVCLRVNSLRGCVLQAEDQKYRWRGTIEWNWHPERFASTFRETYSGSPYYMLPASMENYFDYDFGNQTQIRAYD